MPHFQLKLQSNLSIELWRDLLGQKTFLETQKHSSDNSNQLNLTTYPHSTSSSQREVMTSLWWVCISNLVSMSINQLVLSNQFSIWSTPLQMFYCKIETQTTLRESKLLLMNQLSVLLEIQPRETQRLDNLLITLWSISSLLFWRKLSRNMIKLWKTTNQWMTFGKLSCLPH